MLTKGDELYKKNEIKGAIRDYNKALELKGPNLKAYLGVSQCYKAMNEYKKSMEYAKMALELKSDSSNALFLLGISLFKQDYPDSALKNLENAIQISPDLSEGHFMIGEIHTSLGRKEDAIKSYTKYLELCKDDKTSKAIREKIARLSGS
jgi:tetratricopeptide (TPR) repeat protein